MGAGVLQEIMLSANIGVGYSPFLLFRFPVADALVDEFEPFIHIGPIKSLGDHSATYTKLRPGSYTFKVKAKTINNSWTEEAGLIITVSPPFWLNGWFIVLVSLLIVLLVLLYIRYRLSSLKPERKT